MPVGTQPNFEPATRNSMETDLGNATLGSENIS